MYIFSLLYNVTVRRTSLSSEDEVALFLHLRSVSLCLEFLYYYYNKRQTLSINHVSISLKNFLHNHQLFRPTQPSCLQLTWWKSHAGNHFNLYDNSASCGIWCIGPVQRLQSVRLFWRFNLHDTVLVMCRWRGNLLWKALHGINTF